jgi:outer membrane biosynthesis protein TonB
MGGVRVMLRAIAEGKADAPDQILERWTWRLARASRKVQDRRASAEFPEAKRLLGALANSRGHRHEENAAKLVNAALELPVAVGAALLASAEGYTPRATQLIEAARERLGTVQEVAGALAENLPQPKVTSGRSRRRKRRKRKKGGTQPQQQQQQQQQAQQAQAQQAPAPEGQQQQAEPAEEKKPKPRPRKKPAPQAKPASAETPAA